MAIRLAVALCLALAVELARAQPFECDPSCKKWGNCNPETGKCLCRWGRTGDNCEVDALPACRLTPEHPPYCGRVTSRSCTCMDQCFKYLCLPNERGDIQCEGHFAREHGCFEREGGPEKQTSMPPEEGEAGVKYYMWALPGNRTEVPASTAMVYGKQRTEPLSKCPDKCNLNGLCFTYTDQNNPAPICSCHRGFKGGACEEEENVCFNQCNGRGKCVNYFCHCEPPYFSIGCSRSKAYPKEVAVPSPVQLKIYMYELPPHVAYEQEEFAGWMGHDPIYNAYNHFLAQFVNSAVRTEDPYEANLFFIPAFTYAYSSNTNEGAQDEHLWHVTNHIKQHWPFWNRTQGRDHIVWTPLDRGACHLSGDITNAIKLTHFGFYSPHPTFPFRGAHPDWGCFHPLRDVAAPPYWALGAAQANATWGAAPQPAAKKTLSLFFAGGMRMEALEYSGSTRQHLYKLAQKWKDPKVVVVEGGVPDYQEKLASSRFCLATYGHGWGIRLVQLMVVGCVPLIIQDHVYQYFEEVLPYEEFSVRLSNADLPRLREILDAVSDEQHARLVEGMRKYWPAFVWEPEAGGKAFDYTILSLWRRSQNLKAKFYGYSGEDVPKWA